MNRIMDSVREQANRFLGADFRKKCDMLAFLFFCLFLFDCCFSGGGRYLKIGPFTPRMIMAGLSFVFSLPGLLTAIKSKKNIVILAMFFAFILCVVINFFRSATHSYYLGYHPFMNIFSSCDLVCYEHLRCHHSGWS